MGAVVVAEQRPQGRCSRGARHTWGPEGDQQEAHRCLRVIRLMKALRASVVFKEGLHEEGLQVALER